MATIEDTCARAELQFVSLSAECGLTVWMLPRELNWLREHGETSIIVPIPDDNSRPKTWLRVTEAATEHLDDIDGLTLTAAKSRIARACSRNEITSTGRGHSRRIEPTSFRAWRLRQAQQNLAGYEGDPK